MIATLPGIENLTLLVTQETQVRANLETTFEALLEQIGPENETGEGNKCRWISRPGREAVYRDLGDGRHLWADVRAIKRAMLLEFRGPLFMSYAVVFEAHNG